MELNKIYAPLFERYGSPTRSAEFSRSYTHLYRPDLIESVESVASYDRQAKRVIDECQALIEQMTAYRQDLAARYNELVTMLSREEIKLERVNCYGSISYYLRFTTVYEDGTRCETASERYDGKARHKAIARFEALKKERRNAEFIKDIAKKQWER